MSILLYYKIKELINKVYKIIFYYFLNIKEYKKYIHFKNYKYPFIRR